MSGEILIVDDEEDIRTLVRGILEDEGYTTREAGGAQEAYEQISAKAPDLVILDIWLQGSADDGLKILENVKKDRPFLPVVMISGHGTIETAVHAIKEGAYDFIEKPFKSDRLLVMIQRALENANLRRENETLRKREDVAGELIGHSAVIESIRQILKKVAPTNSRVLLSGEPGAGKNMAARYIHAHSKRANEPFMILNCTTLNPERLEIELFGSVAGVHGDPPRAGLLEIADGGTLLLDEVGDMPIEIQGKLVKFLQDDTYQKVGDKKQQTANVRIIASSSKHLNVESGAFRSDLYFRLNVVPVDIPPLRERNQDLQELIKNLSESLSKQHGLVARDFTEDAVLYLQTCKWPGNIRQLRNVIEWVMIMKSGSVSPDQSFSFDDLPPEIRGKELVDVNAADQETTSYANFLGLPLREAREKFEREYLQAQVERFDGNISRTSQFVGMERSALHRKLKSLEISSNDKDNTSATELGTKKTAIA